MKVAAPLGTFRQQLADSIGHGERVVFERNVFVGEIEFARNLRGGYGKALTIDIVDPHRGEQQAVNPSTEILDRRLHVFPFGANKAV